MKRTTKIINYFNINNDTDNIFLLLCVTGMKYYTIGKMTHVQILVNLFFN
jgi:hypothetical protein